MPRGSGGFFCAEPRAGTALQPALPAAQGLMSLHHILPLPKSTCRRPSTAFCRALDAEEEYNEIDEVATGLIARRRGRDALPPRDTQVRRGCLDMACCAVAGAG